MLPRWWAGSTQTLRSQEGSVPALVIQRKGNARVGDGPWRRSSGVTDHWRSVKELGLCLAQGNRHRLWGIHESPRLRRRADEEPSELLNRIFWSAHGRLLMLLLPWSSSLSYSPFSARARFKTLFDISRWHPLPEAGMVATWHEPTETARGPGTVSLASGATRRTPGPHAE